MPLVGDVRAVVPQLTRALGEGRQAGPDLEKFIKDGKAELDQLAQDVLENSDGSGDVPCHTMRFIVECTKALPADGIMARDGGATVIFGWTYNQYKPNDVIWNQNYRRNLPLVYIVGVDFQWRLEVGLYKRTFGLGTAETGTHWSETVRFDKIAEGLGAHGEFVRLAEDIGPAIARGYARGGVTMIHVPIDPKANSEEMPKCEKFRTWYAEGMQ